ncbi:hypothetical protein A5740_10455 [Mycobacterium sp. GA-1841]|uniref:hypothetical protein n=1 Tax=Mycobacterium sp. GA-1841 TaxID=1834154 RepID=UPI00096BFC6F|nr:hypothetical protein [Mycobacterium sp. GA-1841]OMC34058.1 hypothetical protein A5740_10455 [Mycobacterium sp. GA-1841]
MLVLGDAFMSLSARSWPDTPGEALARFIAICLLMAIILPSAAGLLWWFNTNRPAAYRRRLEQGSAEFRVRWPADQLGYAPYGELDKEAQRCWMILLLLEEGMLVARDSEKRAKDIAAVRHWISIVVAALNAAAARDRQAAVAEGFK